MLKKQTTLIFLTASFPFGSGETFIESEIDVLSQTFDQIILVSNDVHNEQTRQVPENVVLKRISYQPVPSEKFKSLRSLFSSFFWKELQVISTQYQIPIDKTIFNTLLISLYQASKFKKYYQQLLQEFALLPENTWFYSYWCNDSALGVSLLKKQLPQIKAVSRGHGWDVYFEVNEAKYLPFRSLIFQSLDRLYYISNFGRKYSLAKVGEHFQEKIEVSRLGVYFRFPPKTHSFEKKEELLLVSCSNIYPLKRLPLIIDALQLISNFKIKWVHFGDGVDKVKTENWAKEKLSPKENISYEFKGRIENTEVLKFYHQNPVDLFINVSESEGIPVSIMEAYSLGIPAIATHVGGSSEIVNNKNGFLISPNPSSSEVAQTIIDFIELSEIEKKRKREAAYQTWNENYNAATNFKAFTNQLFQL